MSADAHWWRHAVIYQVYIRSFADGDGDGVGDLPGIRSRLPYLRGLGVDAVWITPFYPSPMADGGYDVADYRDIEPQFGTLGRRRRPDRRRPCPRAARHHRHRPQPLVRPASVVPGRPRGRTGQSGARPLRVPARSRARRCAPPTDWDSTFGGPAWQRVPDGEWYLHLFAPEQPDFNWENPEVVAEFEDILRFWLDRGVDGFRIDVANSLKKDQSFPDVGTEEAAILVPHEGPDHPFWDREDVHEVYRGWRSVSDAYGADRTFVAEAWVDSPDRLARYTRADELHTAFNFSFVRAPWEADDLRKTIDECIAAAASVGAPTTWVLSNHDVTRHATRYARLDSTGGGVSDEARVGPDTPLDPALGLRRARAATLLMLALPGSAYIYQGEELGLPEVVDLPEEVLADPIWERSGHTVRGRDGARVPIPWTRQGPSLGFGGGPPWLPQPTSWSEPVGRGAGRCRRVDAGALPLRTRACGAASRRSATVPCDGSTARPTPWSSNGRTPARGSSARSTSALTRCRSRRTTRCCSQVRRWTPDGRLPSDTAVWLRPA